MAKWFEWPSIKKCKLEGQLIMWVERTNGKELNHHGWCLIYKRSLKAWAETWKKIKDLIAHWTMFKMMGYFTVNKKHFSEAKSKSNFIWMIVEEQHFQIDEWKSLSILLNCSYWSTCTRSVMLVFGIIGDWSSSSEKVSVFVVMYW